MGYGSISKLKKTQKCGCDNAHDNIPQISVMSLAGPNKRSDWQGAS
jgi:hypothetical protein